MTRFLLLIALAFSVAACDSSEPEEPVEQPPTFSIASRVVTLVDNSQGLQFFATPNDDVSLVRVDVRNPIGQSETFDAQRVIVLSGEVTPLQDPNFGYNRISGTWNFRFVGSRAAGSQQTFDLTVPLDVSALRPAPEVEVR